MVLLCCCAPLFAQSTVANLKIDGSINPERIPDATAYRLVFTAIAKNTEDPKQLNSVLRKIGLNGVDTQVLLDRVFQFSVENSTAEDTTPAVATFGRLKNQLSADGLVKLAQYIQSEKSQMKIFTSGVKK